MPICEYRYSLQTLELYITFINLVIKLSVQQWNKFQGEETTLSRLTSYAEYEIRVRAHNAAGDGPLTAAQVCRTDEDG